LRHEFRKKDWLLDSECVNSLSVEKKLHILYKDLKPERCELVNNRYYYGVLKPWDILHLSDVELPSRSGCKVDKFFLYESVCHSGNYDMRIYSPCGDGVNITVLYDECLKMWTFYTDLNVSKYKRKDYERYKHILLYQRYEDIKYKRSFFKTLDSLVDCIRKSYVCETCYDLSGYPITITGVCLSRPANRYTYVWPLKKICFFFVYNTFWHKRHLLKGIVPQSLSDLIEVEGRYEGQAKARKNKIYFFA
jgi:hypothetical protein